MHRRGGVSLTLLLWSPDQKQTASLDLLCSHSVCSSTLSAALRSYCDVLCRGGGCGVTRWETQWNGLAPSPCQLSVHVFLPWHISYSTRSEAGSSLLNHCIPWPWLIVFHTVAPPPKFSDEIHKQHRLNQTVLVQQLAGCLSWSHSVSINDGAYCRL